MIRKETNSRTLFDLSSGHVVAVMELKQLSDRAVILNHEKMIMYVGNMYRMFFLYSEDFNKAADNCIIHAMEKVNKSIERIEKEASWRPIQIQFRTLSNKMDEITKAMNLAREASWNLAR